MAFRDLKDEPQIAMLQRSLERGRLGHAYLLEGEDMELLESVARNLSKTLNCDNPVKASPSELPVDCCDRCPPCRRTDSETHPDVHWLHPESKSRVIRAEQIRDLLEVVHLKPNEGGYKVAILAGADRMNTQAANIFLKTLEEPPSRSVMLLLTTEPQRLLETILSRCLRLRFGTGILPTPPSEDMDWIKQFTALAATEEKNLIGRYRLLGLLLNHLAGKKARIEGELEGRSPLEKHDDVEKSLKEKWEAELTAGIEAEYRRQRMSLLGLIQLWLRDVWLRTVDPESTLLAFSDLAETRKFATRISSRDAMHNLEIIEQAQRLLHTNVQEALALEVCLLKLKL